MKELKTIRDILQALLDGHEVEMKSEHKNTWVIVASMLFDTRYLDDEKELQGKYRIKTTKPSINWEHVSKDLNYLAKDKDGEGYLFKERPSIVADAMLEARESKS